MTNDERPIEVGDRFESRDRRDEGRIVEVRELRSDDRYRIQVEVHPKNPSAVGRRSTISGHTLRRIYTRISR